MLKLIFENGEWKGFEAPEKPHFKQPLADTLEYLKAYAEARANAMKVLNPEIVEAFTETKEWTINKLKQQGEEYDWTGSYELKQSMYFRPGMNHEFLIPEGYVLSLPSNSAIGYSKGSEGDPAIVVKWLIEGIPGQPFLKEGSEVPKLSKERVKEIEDGVNWYRGETKEETQDELWKELQSVFVRTTFLTYDKNMEELKAKYILTRRSQTSTQNEGSSNPDNT